MREDTFELVQVIVLLFLLVFMIGGTAWIVHTECSEGIVNPVCPQ